MRSLPFFAQISSRTKWNADDLHVAIELFLRLGVILTDFRINYHAGQQINSFYIGMLAQRAGQLGDVKDLAAGIRVPTELKIPAAEKTVDTN